MPLLVFEEAFDRFRFGIGSAKMLALYAGLGLLLLLAYRLIWTEVYADEVWSGLTENVSLALES